METCDKPPNSLKTYICMSVRFSVKPLVIVAAVIVVAVIVAAVDECSELAPHLRK